ncbi:hypothetical protein K1719_037483 [Acacia pycnantha]|nr:hypothetical protein K1719_037483 [Acacia pycnantha]
MVWFSWLGFPDLLDNTGIEPRVEKIGKYKSAGDQLTRRTMSEETCEMMTALLDDIYTNWLDKVSSSRGKKREEIENFINEGIYQVDRLKEEGLITNIISILVEYSGAVLGVLSTLLYGQRMESSSLDSIVSSLSMDDDVHIPHQFSSITKLHNNGPGTTSVHELLEFPVCTSSISYTLISSGASRSSFLGLPVDVARAGMLVAVCTWRNTGI